jgi:hypothetical protein
MSVRKEREIPMIHLLLAGSIAIHKVLRRYMPTNIIRDLIRTRRGLKWGVPAMLLAAPYFAVAYWLTSLLAGGAPGWLNLLVLLCVWSGFKLLWLGPISIVLVIRACAREFAARRRQIKAQQAERAECIRIAFASGYQIAWHVHDQSPDHSGLDQLLNTAPRSKRDRRACPEFGHFVSA